MKFSISHIVILYFMVIPFFAQASERDYSFSESITDGDCLFQSGEFTQAILHYEKARRFNTAHSELNSNLISAYEQTDNRAKILIIDEIRSARHVVTSPNRLNYFVFGSFIFLVVCGILITRSFRKRVPVNRWFWWSLTSFLIVFIITLFSIDDLNPHAIVTANEIPVSESTSGVSENVSILNKGYKLEVLETAGEWTLVKLATGQTGWIKSSALEMI